MKPLRGQKLSSFKFLTPRAHTQGKVWRSCKEACDDLHICLRNSRPERLCVACWERWILYNYSYDPAADYFQFVDNSHFAMDGVISEFPRSASNAIGKWDGKWVATGTGQNGGVLQLRLLGTECGESLESN
nr:glycerophosphodiester phosphodiesterase GDPDL7 [Tanacetum cinerariifolium]